MIQISLFISLVLITFFRVQDDRITVYLIGDSTMSIKEVNAYPETGWGMPFVHFFDSTVVVDNRAKNGRSTKTFLSENRWNSVLETLKANDYVFIQFGHNDESESKKERYTTPEQYRKNLELFITETQVRGAIPVILTPVARRRFDTSGNVIESHAVYSQIVREIASEQKVAFIDLDRKSQALYQKFGDENSRLLFLQLNPGEHPNYPNGKDDNTHFNELGARLVAEIVLAEIRTINLPLAERVVKGTR